MSKHALEEASDNGATDLEDLIGYNLKRAYIIVQSGFRDAQGEGGFSPRVFTALALTVKFPNITQSALARKMGIERSGLVAIVDELESKALLARARVPGDRRVQALVPTEAGQQAYDAAMASVRAHEQDVFSNMSESEKKMLLDLLRKVRKNEVS